MVFYSIGGAGDVGYGTEGIELGMHATKRALRALSSVRRILYGRVRVEDVLQSLGSRRTCDSFCLRPWLQAKAI